MDPLGAVSETDETNNVSSAGMVIVVAAGADLLLSTAQIIGASTAPAGGSVLAQYEIQNAGPSPASSSAIGFYLSANSTLEPTDVLLTTLPGGQLGGNRNSGLFGVNLTIPSNTTPGPYYILFVADPRNSVAETNENNNIRAVPLAVTVATAALATLSDFTLAVAPNPVGQDSRITCYLNGAGRQQAATLVIYNALGQRVHSQAVQLGAVQSQRFQVLMPSVASGSYLLHLAGSGMSVTRRFQVE
jgi:hypothetical protein